MTRRRKPNALQMAPFEQFEKQKQAEWRRISIPIINSIMNPHSNLDDQIDRLKNCNCAYIMSNFQDSDITILR